MFKKIPRWTVTIATGCGLWFLAGCGGGGGSSVPTPTPTATPGSDDFNLNAMITGATDPAVPTVFVTMQGQGDIDEATQPASFNATFFRDSINNRVLRFKATSARPLYEGQKFAVTTNGAAQLSYRDIPNQRFFVAQSGTLRIDDMADNSAAGVQMLRFTLDDVRLVPDTTVPFNSAVGSFMLDANGQFSDELGTFIAVR